MPNNLLLYEGETASGLYANFKETIDSYLECCARNGIKARKGYNGVLNIRIPSEMHSQIAIYAESHGTSINSFIRDSIKKRLEVEYAL